MQRARWSELRQVHNNTVSAYVQEKCTVRDHGLGDLPRTATRGVIRTERMDPSDGFAVVVVVSVTQGRLGAAS